MATPDKFLIQKNPFGDGTFHYVPDRLEEAFKQLVQRGANLWPDAPPEIKEFADLVTNGAILQDYRGQDTSPTKARLGKSLLREATKPPEHDPKIPIDTSRIPKSFA